MKTLKQLERLRKVHELIKQAKTGSPKKLAARLNISERQFYNIIEHLKDLEAPINYDRKTHTYFYTTDFDLLVHVSVQIMVNSEIRDIYAGYTPLNENFMATNLLALY